MELLFVHGALVRDGGWWWRRAAALLEKRTGVRSRSLALPSCGEGDGDSEAPAGLVADAAALRNALDESDGAVLVGHSYGGTVIAEAGAHPAVAGLLLISSYLPEVGLSQGAVMSGEPDPVRIGLLPDGSLHISGYDAASFAARFLQDADDEDRAGAWDRVTSQSAAAFSTPTTAAGWQGVDSTYVVCTGDRSTTVALQRFHAARATRSVDIPTGHHPFLTRPDLIVTELEALLR
ncbi:alpha/beta hydrolase [Rathayibacter iranicus]|uniref:Alpha/beta hydrolase n=2 Tax=Rathayibacter iranicus TaxID=59737 RepID=A0AAD1AEB5_9MICO|nr:alpha/beta hydrolase [Rathayibacter iranicus]AZZ54626.1 alpha/beta hydrolase [Rathayibacter iranicus]MWV30412.1 alpha/beta fold hydrolase [Rathayibacter iranicus NCPPB 2253 = VKM Ac-1602]PPI51203.1 alpha/beta hydrolase [Rathayibacter iranicus]PPI63405.1 alpha/beta hydrolase [Rathayibacter iranicus]PPI74115.1 alpha/beta hydrolase [Rathayibacter iranicus]